MNLSIRYRISLTLSLVVLLLAAVYALTLLAVARQRLTSELDQKLDIEAFVTADLIRLAPDEVPQKLRLRDIVETEEEESPEARMDLDVWQDTSLVYRRLSVGSTGLLATLALQTGGQNTNSQDFAGRRARVAQREFKYRGANWIVRVASDESGVTASLSDLRWAVLASAPGVLAVAMLLSYWLAGRTLRPLALIATDANSISALNIERRVDVPATHDEIAVLASAFNRLLDRLQTAFTELREFTANASHELRTPLTALHSIGENALTVSLTARQYRDAIGHMLEEAHRLTQLVESLLLLARSDAGTHESKRGSKSVALLEVVETACAHLRPLAQERDQRLSVHCAVAPQTSTDSELVELALVNIVHNAIKFTPVGGCIDVHVDETESVVTIVVEDTGPGIPAFEQERVFDRFYRSDRTRSSAHGGFGLGLSIARASIAKLGGSVSAGRSAAGGTQVIIAIQRSKQRAMPIA